MHPFLDLGLNLQRFNAIAPSKEEALQAVDASTRKTLLDPWPRNTQEELKGVGAVGCYLSHLHIWEEFLASSDSLALILEDDVHPRHAKDLTQSIQWLMDRQEQWDIGLLGWVGTLYDPTKGFIGSHAYLLTRHGATTLVRDARPLSMQLDFYLNTAIRNGLRMVVVPREMRIAQASSSSNVYTTTWLHWVYFGMAIFSVAFVSLRYFEQRKR